MLVIYSTADRLAILTKLGVVVSQYQHVTLEFASTIEELQALAPNASAIFSLGANALDSIQQLGQLPKNRKVTGLRKQVLLAFGKPTMVSYSPTIGDVDYGQYVDLLMDTGSALRLASTGSTNPKYGDYKYIKSLKDVVGPVKALVEQGQTVDLAFDTETLGLDRFHPEGYLISLQFSWQVGTGVMIAFQSKKQSLDFLLDIDNQNDLYWLLNCSQISLRAANGKYDLEWVYEQCGVTCTNFKIDTTLVGSILDENRSNGLDVHCKIYAPDLGGYSDEFDQKADKSRMDLEFQKDPLGFLNYSAGDGDATLRVAQAQKKLLLQDQALTGFYVNILHPAARAFEIVERGGVFVDKQAFDELEADLIADLHRLTNSAKGIVGGILSAKHYDQDKIGGLNLTKASLINDFMFSPQGLNLKPKMLTEKTKAPVTSMEHLEMFKDHPEAKGFVSCLSEFSSTNKTLGTYIVGFRKHIRSDGRLHPTYFLFAGNKDEGEGGTNTGRLSVKDPAFQCCNGRSLVYNKEGWTRLDEMVSQYEQGKPYSVLTHTGEWKPVVGVYRNGVKPILKITTASGAVLECTDNHPWLTDLGFVQAGKLTIGTPVWRFYEGTSSSGGVKDWPLDSNSGLGFERKGAPNVSSPVRVWDNEESTRLQSNWDEAEQVLWLLQAGQTVNAWTQHQRERITDLLVLAAHEVPMPQPGQQGLQDLWRKGYICLRFVERFIRDFSSRYGREAAESHIREIGREWELQQSQLHLGDSLSASPEQDELSVSDAERGDQTPVRLGRTAWCEALQYCDASAQRVERDSSPYHAFQAAKAGFVQDHITAIEAVPAEETYDLTIADSHSFVANGLVVHNTIPKHTHWGKRIRKCYTAPPGYQVLECDYSQGELRVIACLANETNMIQAYANGLDLHVVTGGNSAGYNYEQMMVLKNENKELFDTLRQLAKAQNFGLIYGMGAEGFMDYARTGYGVALTLKEADEARTKFFDTYPILLQYHDVYKRFAHKHGYVRSPLGRVRHLPLINSPRREVQSQEERRAINSPVQGALSDMMIWAISEQNRMGWFDQTPCFGAIHDAGYYYIPEDNREFYAKRIVEVMENLPFAQVGWKPQLKFIADAKAGPSMGDLKELKF